MNYLLDTNILLLYLRKSNLISQIDSLYSPLGSSNTSIVSVVSLGELRSLAIQNHWGERKLHDLEKLLEGFLVADINAESIIERYAEIDSFSQGKLTVNSTDVESARNMGKNDLWIAATASILEAKLLTTDKDFAHLDEVYLDLGLIQL